MKRRRKRPPKLSGMRPESLMMSFGYRPEDSEGAVKPPIFQTSTFVFRSAEEGKEFFSWAYGLEERDPRKPMGLIYSRLNNPDLEILEDRLNLWDGAEESAVFASGMAAISTTLLALVPVRRSVVFSPPVYGGTDYLMEHILPDFGIPTREFPAGGDPAEVERICRELEQEGTPCALVFLETPANPTITLTDIEGCAEVAHQFGALCAVDNTFLGPLYQSPLRHGADLVLYSATKYLGGHCDLLAGAVLGSVELVEKIKATRTILGTMLDPELGMADDALSRDRKAPHDLRAQERRARRHVAEAATPSQPRALRRLPGEPSSEANLRATVHRAGRHHLVRARERGRKGSLPVSQRRANDQTGGQPGGNRVTHRAPGVDDPLRRSGRRTARGRHHAWVSATVGRHRASRRHHRGPCLRPRSGRRKRASGIGRGD